MQWHKTRVGRVVIGAGGLLLLVFALGSILFPVKTAADEIVYGYTFSAMRAEELGYNPVALYERLAEDLAFKRVRIPVYWDRLAPEPGVYDFSEIDALLEVARSHGHQVTLAIGQRVPRWPECFVPEWTNTLSSVGAVDRLQLAMVEEVVNRYKDDATVVRWQVENEPYFALFGECLEYNVSALPEEFALVRRLDPDTPTMTTGSGEQSLWRRQAALADVVGTSVYRTVHNNVTGYITMPVPTWTYRARAAFLNRPVVVSELQMEPWLTDTLDAYTSDKLADLFPYKKARRHLAYVERIGFPEVLLWGVEWAAYMQDQGYPEYVELIKTLP